MRRRITLNTPNLPEFPELASGATELIDLPKDDSPVQVFHWDGEFLTTILDDRGSFWVLADEVATLLEYSTTQRVTDIVSDKYKGYSQTVTLGGVQNKCVISEPGLYQAIFRSNKPEAERFRDWVFETVLPEIRRYGTFEAAKDPSFGESLRKLREAAGYSQYMLGKTSKVSAGSIKAYEEGKCIPKARTFLKLRKVLGDKLPIPHKEPDSAQPVEKLNSKLHRQVCKVKYDLATGGLNVPQAVTRLHELEGSLLMASCEPA